MPSTLSDPDYQAFVRHLVELRRRQHVSQDELAARLGRPQSYVSKSERLERRLDPAEFARWVVALGGDPAAEFAAVLAGLTGRPAPS
jgi:transcriptional regulator with XRE-family HTH domain